MTHRVGARVNIANIANIALNSTQSDASDTENAYNTDIDTQREGGGVHALRERERKRERENKHIETMQLVVHSNRYTG